jgi:NitT/TauT family transport system ATP-binding protein
MGGTVPGTASGTVPGSVPGTSRPAETAGRASPGSRRTTVCRMEPVGISVRGAAHAYGERQTLAGVDIEVPPGGRVAVVGPSGCGKSTLLSLVAGLDELDAGAIAVGGESSSEGRLARCALMPQRDLLLPWRTALDNAGVALENAGRSRQEARAQAAPLFERFGLGGFEATRPAELSGGMRQRVAFLRTLLAGKPVLLLDEPFGALDAITREDLQGWLSEALETSPRTVLLVTHDVDEAVRLADRVVVLSSRPARVVLSVDAARTDRATLLEALR